MGTRSPEADVAALASMLVDPAAPVRRSAATALGKIKDGVTATPLLPLLEAALGVS